MRKLMAANLFRLMRDKMFWALFSGSFIAGAAVYVLLYANTRILGSIWLLNSANSYFFFFTLFIGVVLAIFCSLFVGTEYQDGTIRNKLVVGHLRRDIYLANLLTNAVAGAAFCAAYLAAAFIVGAVTLGVAPFAAISPPLWRMLFIALMLAAYCSVFTFAAMLDSSKARCAVVSLLLSLLLLVCGDFVYSRLREPELTARMIMQQDGSYELMENVPNSRYLSGAKRTAFEWVEAAMPFAQAMRIVDRDGEADARALVCLSALSALTTLAGAALFEKKDIK